MMEPPAVVQERTLDDLSGRRLFDARGFLGSETHAAYRVRILKFNETPYAVLWISGDIEGQACAELDLEHLDLFITALQDARDALTPPEVGLAVEDVAGITDALRGQPLISHLSRYYLGLPGAFVVPSGALGAPQADDPSPGHTEGAAKDDRVS